MKNHFSSKINRLVIALTGVLVLSIGSAYAGSAYSDGRAYLRQGSPSGAGKVYVSTSSSTPAASSYKACNTIQTSETTTPSASAQVKGEKTKTTYHFWAVANAGYIFTGWYDSNGNLLGSGAAHVSGSVTSGQAGGSDTHAYLDYHASFIKQIQMSFITPTNGSYTITHCGTEVTPAYSSFATEGKVVLSAMPADGYKLRGWYTTTNGGTTKKYFAFGTTCEPNFTSNVTIGADFVADDGKATFWNKNNGKIYNDLNTANSEASSGHVIVAVSDGVLGAGTYTIKAGVTLLIPFDETYNLMTTPKVNHMASGTTSLFLFRKLTLAPGAIINCSGNICVGGQMASVNGGRASSYPMGACGMLDLSRGGTINLKSGSILYAWGFVKGQDMEQGNNTEASGVGKIVAESGATVWEDFQVGEWRGGTASSTIYSNKGSWKFFPFQSYTIQNVEAPVEYRTGSKLKCYWAIFGNGQTFTVPFTAVGASADKPLFVLGSGGTMKKWYDPTTDRVCYELGGGASIDAISLSVMGEDVSSSDYYLPIPANMHIALRSGCTLNLTKAMTMHAGSVVEVKSGATLNINARVHMFDQEDWGTYCMYAYYYRTYRNLTSHYNRGEGTSKATLEDATLIVDGTVNVGNQMLYATAHGANICGNGGGTLKYGTLPGNTTMTQCTNLSDANSVNIRSANLHNDNGSYTKGMASKLFYNVNGRWFVTGKQNEKANHTYDFTYISSGDVYGTGGTNKTTPACYSKDKTGLVLQDKWANIKAAGCTNWWTGIDDSHLYNWSRNSAWHQYILTGSVTTGEGEEAVTTETYVGSDGKMLYKTDCEFVEAGTIDGNCLYPSDKALVNGSLITVAPNASPDHGYHKSDAASTYYLCFEGCVWHPATQNAENRYTVDGKVYIWYGDKWLGVEYDSSVSHYYSLSATNVKIYYEYVNHEWVLATPVAEVTTSAGTEQVYSLATAVSKAAAGGTNVTIRLLKNLSGTISYTGANNCGLDLNGYTLSSSSSSMITMNNASGTLIIKDQSAAGTGKIQATFNRSTDKVYGLNVTKGHIVLNSGTVHIENTNASQGACGVYIYSGYKFTINGGTLEVKSKGETWGIHTLETTTSVVTVNGGTIDTKTTSTSAALVGIHSLGGTININGGTLATSTTTVKTGLTKGIEATNAKTILNVTGGTIESTAPSKVYGLKIAGASPVTISGGKIIATAKDSLKAYGVISEAAGALTINGGKIYANAKTNYAYGLYTGTGRTIINSNDTIHATAVSRYAYGVYTYNSAGRVWFNNGVVDVTAPREVYGLYVYASTDTINGGEFLVHASGSSRAAYGIYLRDNANPKCMVNGGKFKVTAATSSYAHINTSFANNIGKLKLAGGYFNITPDSANFVVAGKSVKDVDRTKEQAIYDAGYVKKIAGNEYTVTWKDHAGNVIGTSQVESGKVPVWTGGEVNCSDANSTREHDGWSTEAWNGGTSYVFPTALPAIGASDVTYFAHYQAIYADVTTGGVTTRYNSAQKAWTAAMAAKQATIRLLSNLGTEASIGNMTQMVFNPTNANSVIIMDLNGHSWTMGRHDIAANNTSPFLHVNPTQTGCKLIITDNSASGNGYLMNSWAKTDGDDLRCVEVNAGELVLQKGGIKVKNTDADHYSYGVVVSGNNAHFTMTGGTVYATDGKSPRGVNVANGYGDIAGGTVEAYSTTYEAYALLSYDTVTVSGGATIRATGTTGSSYGAYCNGAAAVLNIDSAFIISNAYQTARGIYSLGGGQTTVDGKSSISATTTTGSGAYALYATGANTKITTNAGSYTATSAGNSAYGVFAENNGAAILNDGSFTVTAAGTNARGVFAQSNATVTVKDGSFNVTSDTHADPSSFGAYAAGGTVNIEDGNFTLNVHKDLSNRNCDLARCGTGASYLNISGGTFTGDSAYHAVRSFGGETMITGNPVFTAQRGVDAGAWASADGTAKVTIDGGTFYCTDNFALYATTHTYNGKTVVGDMTVLDGKFHTKSSIKPIYASSRPSYLKIKGGYFTSYTASDISKNALDSFVVAPSYTTAVESTDPMYASPNDYRYRVNTKFTVTWKDGATTLKTQEYNRNEIPSYGGDYNPSTSEETYEFLGWSPAIGPVTKDTTYTALKQKYEAEVFETGSASTRKYASITDAWADVQKIPNGTMRILSNCYKGITLTYNPAPEAGIEEGMPGYFTTATTTIDLNGHTYNCYTSTTDTYALEMKKAGCKLIITDTSGKTSGYFGHMNYNAPNCRYRGVKLEKGELVLAGGTLRTQNTYPYLADDSEDFSSSGAYTVLVYAGTTFTMTGGTLLAEAHKNARAVCFVGNGVANISGGEIKVLAQYKKKDDATQYYGAGAYGVIADNLGGTANISGTVTITSKAYSSAIGVYVNASTNAAEANISGGSIDCWAKTQASMPVYCYQTKAVTNISGGSFKANCSQDASAWNTETVSVHKGATVNISGGTYESTTGSNCNAVRNFGGTVTITGNPLFKTRQGVNAGDYAEATATATVYVNGGTFNNKGYCFYANTSTNDNGTVTGKVYVNAGYFNSYGGSICSGTAGTNLVLNGGYYKERSGTSTKTNITTYKGATTTVSTLSPAITVADTTYHYQLLTDFNITWLGGESYSKVTQVKSGVVPTNTDLDGKCFIRSDSAFYFTGWSPTPSPVIDNTTYQAIGDYYEAEVKIGSGAWTRYTDFLEAWEVVQENANCTIRLLSNLTLADKIVYRPEVANARTTFDLNNFTLSVGGTVDRLLEFNKADAILTITDNSTAKGGTLSIIRTSAGNVYTTCVHNGELKMTGGRIYVENNQNDDTWHPAIAVYVAASDNAKLTMTSGTLESKAKYCAYTVQSYGITNITGGTVKANSPGLDDGSNGYAIGIYAVQRTTTIGGTAKIEATGLMSINGAMATGWISTDGQTRYNGTLNITGGTIDVTATAKNACGVQANATSKTVDGTNYGAHGIVNISGGTFNVKCSAATATQVFAVQVNAARIFDTATPHNLLLEEKAEANISGGTFLVDSRNNGAWVANGSNIDLLRNWGTLNVSGGTFTVYQRNAAVGVASYRNKATISGNPVFNINSYATARGVVAGPWNHSSYCDADASKNLAEIEVNGGTFNVKTESDLSIGAWAYGGISADSYNATTSAQTGWAGYAMNAKVTVNGGEFVCINPTANNSRAFRQENTRTGTYGSATAQIIVRGGKFKPLFGTAEPYSSTGTHNVTLPDNNDKRTVLAGGYYVHNTELATFVADTCVITEITSTAVDPEYANGYRYMIKTHYVARVTATGVDRKFTTFRGAFDYAKTIANSKITLLDNINYTGLNFVYNPATATSCTLDLNGYTFKGAISGHTGDEAYNNDRLLVINKAGATFTIKDSSVGKTGKWSHEKAGAGFSVIVYHGNFVLESGTVHCKNTSSGSAQAVRSENYTDALVSITGGKAHAETAGTAYGLNTYNKATVSGGEILAESSAGAAYGVFNNEAIDTTIISGGKIKASGTNSYGVLARAVTTISGGKILSECTSADGTAFGVKTEQNATTINGVDSIYAHAARYAYGVHCQGSTAVVTINGANKIIAHNVNSANNGASIAAYVLSSGTININNGTFYAKCDRAGSSNVQTTRTGQNGVLNISGGTFHAEGFQAVNARGGTTTISGGTFTSTTGICAMDWADAATITANVNVTGGTFTTTGTTIYVSSNNANNGGRNGHSVVWINGGKFKSTGSTIVSMNATPSGADPSTLTIAGGYFNEKSGTTFKDQIATYVADTSEINTLDPLYEGIYKYEVAPHYVAKVKTGSTTTNYTTIKGALDYAKTVASPTITLLDNCTLESGGDANYNKLTANSWTGTLDLNGFTLTPTFDGMGRALTVGGTGSKLTIKDSASGGKIYYQGGSTMTLICFVMEGSAEIEWASGTLYVENTSATYEVNGFVVNSANSKFTQSGGTFTLKGKYRARGYYGSGTVTLTGGTMNVTGETSQAIGLHPNTATSVLNISGTFALNAESDNYAYGVYTQNGTATIEGTPALNVKAPTRARVLQGTGGSTTVNGGLFEANGTTASQSDCYALISEGTSTMTVGGGKFKTNQNNIAYKSTDATLTINGGYFNEKSGTTHKTQVETYKADGKVVLNLDTDDAEYAAGYRYLVTADPVAKVKAGSEITYYTTLPTAFDYAKTQNNAEVTLLKDIVSTSTYTWAPSSAISNTFDLNGHSLSSTAGTVLGVGKAGATLIIKDTPGGGSISYSSTTGNWSPTVHVGNGKLVLQGGTISRTANSDNAIGVQVYTTADATPEFEMTGGKIQTSGGSSSYAVLTKSTGSNYAETTISGGEVSATATGTYAFALTAAQKGNITVKGTNNPKISASDATNATQVARNEGGGATFTIEGGLFKASRNASPFSGTVSISGGYFNEYGSTTTYKTAIEGCTSDPKHPIELTAAEQAALGEGGTDYKYKVVDAYTLTWTTDGDALTGDYTSGMTAVGATIVQPNTPTKTGYTFSAWTPAVAATMPAANTTYTATWTAKSCTVTFDKEGGEGGSDNTTATYNAAMTTITAPTKTGYTFGGYWDGDDGTGTQYYNADGTSARTWDKNTTAATTLYAKWTPNTYTITLNGNNGSGHTASVTATYNSATLSSAITNPTRDGWTFTGWYTAASGSTLVINVDGTLKANVTDYTGAGGIWTATENKTLYAHWLQNVVSVTVGGETRNYTNSAAQWTEAMNFAKTGNATVNVLQNCTVATRLTYDPASAYTCTFDLNGKKLTYTASGSPFITVNKAGAKLIIQNTGGAANGEIYQKYSATTADMKTVAVTAGTVEVKGGTIHVENSGTSTNSYKTYAVEVATGGTLTMTDGILYADGGTKSAPSAACVNGGTATISGGKFKVSNGYILRYLSGTLTTTGGYYTANSVGLSSGNTTLDTYCSDPKHLVPTTAADKSSVGSEYNWKVATAYRLSWTTDGDALTGDYTKGWYSGVYAGTGYVEPGATLVAPNTPTKTGYTFNAWTPAFTGTMPAANTTYTATWDINVAEVTINGVTTPYTTLQGAFDAANAAAAAPTIKMLQDVSGIASSLVYNGSNNCTLDLNHHTIAGSVTKLINVNASGKTFTIDDSSAEKDGTISMIGSDNSRLYALYITAGTVNLKHGKIYAKNEAVYIKTTAASVAATAVYVTKGQTFILDDGTVESEAQRASYAILADKAGTTTITINGGLVKGHTNANTTAAGIYTYAKGLTVNGGRIVGHAWTSTSYGIYLYGGTATLNGGTIEATNDTTYNNGTTTTYGVYVRYSSATYAGVLTVPAASTVKVLAKSRTTTATAVYVYAASTGSTIAGGTFTAIAKTSTTAYGINSIGNITVSGGTFNVTATGTAFGALASGLISKKGVIYRGTVDVQGGTFNVTATTGEGAYGAYAQRTYLSMWTTTNDSVPGNYAVCGIANVSGGEFNVKAKTKNAYGIYMHTRTQNKNTSLASVTAYGKGTITGGKFKVETTDDSNATAYAMNTYAPKDSLLIQGGWYSTKKMDDSKNMETRYTHSGKGSSLYRVFDVVPALESKYNYKVARFYTITYDKGANGTGTIAAGYKADGDDFTLSSSTFTRTGYTQTGWSESDGGAKVYELGGTYSENADLTVYPFWSANNYTLTLNNQSATTAGTPSITVTYNSNTNLTATPAITVPTKTGYTFGGYYVEQGGGGKQVIAANGNVNASVSGITDASKNWIASTGGTIYAKWTQTVTLHDNNGGINNGSLEVRYNSTYKLGTPPKREGYTAEGYYAEPACTNKVLTTAAVWVDYSGWVEGGKWVHDGESTLYTKWIEDTHTVTVAAGANGSASPASVTAGITTASGDITATPATGYHFTNWTLVSGVTAASTYSTTSNPIRINATADGKTITANFAPDVFTITYDLDGGSVAVENPTSYTITSATITLNNPTKTGYTFAGWTGTGLDAATTTVTIAAGSTGDRSYKATWTANTYSVRFNKNDEGATGTMSNESFTYDVAKALTANAFTKTGYNFTGWATSAGGDVVYTDGQSVSNLSSTQGAVVDLYAKWSAATYTVTLNQNGATTSGSTSVTMTYGSADHSEITNPKKTGYTFGGWYTSKTSGSRIINTDGTLRNKADYVVGGLWIRTEATTLYARWTQTVTLHDNNGGSHNGSATAIYYSKAALTVTSPTREGYTVEGYYAEAGCTNKVMTDAGVLVNYSGYVVSDRWVHSGATTLYAKWTEDTHTVTVAAGANGSASPASVTAGITTPSETITATPNTGYHFDNWTIPAGVTIASGSTTSPSITINATADDLTITANFAVNSYDVTLNTNGGTINAGNVTSYTYGVGATLPTDVTKAGYTFAGWFDNSELTGSAVTTISTTATGDKEYWAKWTPVALLRFTGATDNQWSKSSNWDPACVPTEAHDIYIQKPCSVDIEHAVAKSIVIDQSSSHTGKLNIGANKGLEVVGTISRTTTGEDNLSTRTEDLILETSTAGNATLIFDNSNSNAATVDLYSKGYIDGSGTKNYQYIGVPVTEANAQSNFYGSWMYSWGIKKNGTWGWVSVKNGASVYPWTGYCITQESPTYYDIHGTLVPTTTKDITVPADENMVIGNSWTAPIDINAFTVDDFENVDCNIYFFNTGVDKKGSAGNAESRYAGGTYVTVPIHSAPYVDGDDHINSMQGFFVKNTNKSVNGTLHLNYANHVRGTTRGSIIGDALHAPSRRVADTDEPVVVKIKVSGENYDDKLVLLEREDFSAGLDNGWDGDKWDGNESALYLYTKDSEGTENSVSAIPELEGTVIGFRAGEDNSYTMYFDYLNSDETIYLYDIEANTYTRIETGGIYWFMTNDNEKHDRFIITRKSPQIATGGGNVQSDDVQGTKACKLILDQKIYILVNGMLYDATGKMVK